MKTRTIATAIRALEKEKQALAKRRDALRALSSELDDLKESCESAFEDLECCIDKLSELV